MPEWTPEPIWPEEDVFIIGGGTSLRDFDWSLLHGENTIGCNNAFRLGPKVCKVCVFVDRKFIVDAPNHMRAGFYDKLEEYGQTNLVVTNDSQLKPFSMDKPWLKWMPRKPKGLFREALGYNANCGGTAINLAILLGAKTIYLLGFDMKLGSDKKPNWHEHVIDRASEEVYVRMLSTFGYVRKDLAAKFPDCKVYNINKDSNLRIFPVLDPDVFWAERKEVKWKQSATSLPNLEHLPSC
jgi:hypothetical protein